MKIKNCKNYICILILNVLLIGIGLTNCGEPPVDDKILETTEIIEREIIYTNTVTIITNGTPSHLTTEDMVLLYVNARELRQQGHEPQNVTVEIKNFITNILINPVTDIAALLIDEKTITNEELSDLKSSGLPTSFNIYGINNNEDGSSEEESLLGELSTTLALDETQITNISVASSVEEVIPVMPEHYQNIKSNYLDFNLEAIDVVVEKSILPPVVSPGAVISRFFANCGETTTIDETISASKTVEYTMGYKIHEGFSISRANSTFATVENETHNSSFSDTTLSGDFKQTFRYGIIGANATTSFKLGFNHNWQHLDEETTKTTLSSEQSSTEQKVVNQNWENVKTVSDTITVSANINIPPQSKIQVDGYINIREKLTVPFVQKLKLTAKAYTNVSYVLERDFSSFYESLEALVITENRIFVADVNRDDIQVLDLNSYEYLASFGEEGTGNGQFQYPTAIAIDNMNQKILVADSTRDDIQIFNLQTYKYLGALGSSGSGDGQFLFPHSLAIKGNRLFVADVHRDDIQVFDLNTYQLIGSFGQNGSGDGEFLYPHSLAILEKQLFVLDGQRDDVQVFDLDNYQFVARFGASGSGAGEFVNPRSIAVSKSKIFISDTMKDDIQIFDSQTYEYLSFLDTSQIEDGLENPTAIALANGRIFVTDEKTTSISTDTIYVFTPELDNGLTVTGEELKYFLYENQFPGTLLEVNENNVILGVQGDFYVGNLIETYTEVFKSGDCP